MAKLMEMKHKRNGKEYAVFMLVIPQAIIRGFGWQKGQELAVSISGKGELRVKET